MELCTMSFSTCGWPSGSIIGHSFNRFVMYVVWRIMRCNDHVVCDHCSIGWHMGCSTPPLMEVIHDAPNIHVLLFHVRPSY
jgi:hypothetical protein